MPLSFLASAYLPDGSSEPQYAALYDKILTYQAKNDRTGQLVLPEPEPAPAKNKTRTAPQGLVRTPVLCDPMSDEAYTLALDNTVHTAALGPCPADLRAFFKHTPPPEGALNLRVG